ncbi:unnamed protein product [Acanthoscelides obtectus]|uniref:Uncharacterized protein n=1 Tax=Acanthoscelides obtectus TaxID=200917 RepID=A0A9P0LVA6_ACAOB|nr:unnamed protein product [Acanthoscelides obtectus]CAK1670838.1 hypothetical protein AOBTE_LOCUS27864 [Acanthoscelides obtectus]
MLYPFQLFTFYLFLLRLTIIAYFVFTINYI